MRLVFQLIVYVLSIVAMWRLFEKAGEAGWKCIIPIYSTYILFKIVTGNGWKMLFLLIPLFDIVYAIIFLFKLARAYGKGTGFGFGLLFLSTIFLLILGLGDSQYMGPQ